MLQISTSHLSLLSVLETPLAMPTAAKACAAHVAVCKAASAWCLCRVPAVHAAER